MNPPARRQYGTGSIFQRASDGRWLGTIQAGWSPNGTRRVITVSYKAKPGESETKVYAEVRRRLEAKKREIERDGLPVAGLSTTVTVKRWADMWLPQHATRVRSNTYETDAGAVRKWIVPTLGTKQLTTLTPGDVRALHLAVTTAGRSTTTARHAHSVLMKMLRAAILEGHQVPQRVLLTEAPPLAANDREAIPLPDALRILQAAADRPDAARWVAALLQGMRQGECLGLTWAAVDLDGGTLDVSWQLDTLPKDEHGKFRIKPGMKVRHLEGSWFLTPVKTAKGQRIIPLVPWMRAALLQWREVAPVSPHDLVWPRADGRPQDERADRLAWVELQRQAGVQHSTGRPFHLHEMRHAAASLLLEAGVDTEVIKAIMGHSSVVTTRGYQHVNQALARKALEDVAHRLQLTTGEGA